MESLQRLFTHWKEIFAFAVMRLIHVSPLKNVEFHCSTSYISATLRNAHVSPESLSNILREICINRKSVTGCMKGFMT